MADICIGVVAKVFNLQVGKSYFSASCDEYIIVSGYRALTIDGVKRFSAFIGITGNGQSLVNNKFTAVCEGYVIISYKRDCITVLRCCHSILQTGEICYCITMRYTCNSSLDRKRCGNVCYIIVSLNCFTGNRDHVCSCDFSSCAAYCVTNDIGAITVLKTGYLCSKCRISVSGNL